jgi:c(7)-type cytochrome triheme protein
MKALALAALIVAAGIASAEPAGGFDHHVHERNLFAGGKDPIPCARCHVERNGRLVGRPDHSSCFGACHGAKPVTPARGAMIRDADRMKVCKSCHAEALLVAPYSGKLAVGYPPYTIDPDFSLSVGHKQHRDVACTQCHADPERKQPVVAHARCISCHDGATGHGPPMSKCAGCHPAASGSPLPPQLAAVHNTVTATFSHGKHAARGNAGKDCATCHAAIRDTDDSQLPRPTVNDCTTSGCHDGAKAFAATEACTRCHASAPADRFVVERPTQRFVHGGSHAKAMKKPCIGCHPASVQGEIVVGGHASCTGPDNCHDADFGKRTPLICGACHNATEPWRHLVADRPPPEVTEFGATLDHRKHDQPCASCHKLRTSTAELRTPRGHAACTTKGCHAVTGGPAPQIGACTGCHELGLSVARTAKRIAAPWSVRTKFDHKPHRGTDGELACKACHVDVTAARVLDLAAPPKPTCAPCHDGKTSFKLTGTQCTRCHLGGPT